MVGTKVGLSVQIAAIESVVVRLPVNALSAGCQPFPIVVFFLLASKANAPIIPEVYISLLGV
jgi:hypothetical protein